ncbi:hypothetical protein TSUD_211510 [Trifolium subterraneum]|uniref:Uncharacterized protein n=1 Tax=Trifolium subterraneum TaxID=3900 RepID=A0A2Z6N1Q5_TRISU|nr:hypothetical protein TSUD_211510 [Trifolium subterraneum]
MFRSMSRGFGTGRYERLGKESATTTLLHEEFKRSTTLPSRASNSSSKIAPRSTFGDINLQRNPTKKVNSKSNKKSTHPLLSFLDFRRKKKTTARPEFARYIEYLKEGGMWDLNSNKPVIYYK